MAFWAYKRAGHLAVGRHAPEFGHRDLGRRLHKAYQPQHHDPHEEVPGAAMKNLMF